MVDLCIYSIYVILYSCICLLAAFMVNQTDVKKAQEFETSSSYTILSHIEQEYYSSASRPKSRRGSIWLLPNCRAV